MQVEGENICAVRLTCSRSRFPGVLRVVTLAGTVPEPLESPQLTRAVPDLGHLSATVREVAAECLLVPEFP